MDAWAAQRYPPPAALVRVEQGRIDAALLDLPPVARWVPALLPPAQSEPTTTRVVPVPGLGERHEISAGMLASAGWRVDAAAVPAFDVDRLQVLLMRLPATLAAHGWRLLRAKGALQTPAGGRLVQWAGGRITIEPLALREGSRIELLADRDAVPEGTADGAAASPVGWSAVDALLLAARAGAD
jgi:hypothetical protein